MAASKLALLSLLLHIGHSKIALPVDVPESLRARALDCEQLVSAGTTAMETGEFLRAAEVFTLGTHTCTHAASMFQNLAVALATLSSTGPTIDVPMLCEARSAAQLAQQLGQAEAGELVSAVQEAIEQQGERTCREALGDVGQRLFDFESAVDLLSASGTSIDQEELVANVRKLCADAEAATMAPSEDESTRGMWRASSLKLISSVVQVCGVVAIENLLPLEMLGDVLTAQQAHMQELRTNASVADVNPRGRHRQEVPLPPRAPFTDDGLTQGPLLLSLVKLLIGAKAELDTFTAIQSEPGSMDQNWHVDAPVPSTLSSGRLPLVGLVAVVPLVDTNVVNGATSFLAGSHVDVGDARIWIGGDDGEGASKETPWLTFSAKVGTVMLFDLRLRHRGGANRGASSRPILYMSYVQDWFSDATNIKARQTKAWDALDSARKKLFARLDSRAYTRQLEALLVANGIDIETVSSAGDYLPGRLEL
eukprot:TRINITY_DN34556_c0_g1_i1.p1 TRINITY_DN34556_c0_g1~~TRINITY_DN34556_c0_g1_i1.p1  ORF type:complete len:492 (-),score=69.77 TRINITY_DN34556_c0_g1_i1:64-1503(-)